MSERTGIAWTDHTFNPWWGCVKVSPGCANCYAEGEAHRRGFDVWGPQADRRGFSAAHWKEPERWNPAAELADAAYEYHFAELFGGAIGAPLVTRKRFQWACIRYAVFLSRGAGRGGK